MLRTSTRTSHARSPTKTSHQNLGNRLIPHIGTGKSDRYWIDPQDLLVAQRYARDRQINILGIYHSHPDHPAVPSESDRLLAWSDYSYLILSVQSGIVSDYRCWTLDQHHQFQLEEVRAQQ
jgi:proteasome lid subunit RPN8/RPN11